jgi:cytochrome c-type biogenesis protein CcsB
VSAARWAEVSTLTFTVALFGYIAAMLVAFAYLAFRRRPLSTASRAIAVAAAGANLVSIVARGIAAGRTPWGNMYEFSALLALLVVVGYLVLVELRMSVRTLGGFVYAFAVFTLAIAALFFDVGPGPLQPALDSYWRNIHVTSMIAASSLLGIGCVVSILFLVQDRRERRELARIRGDGPPPIMGASVDADAPPDYAVGADEPAGPDPSAIPAVRRGVLPSAATLDRIAYRMIAFGFPVWTFGVICGAIWAQEAWGRYWGWDPKETWSFITWTIFAGYLHARATSGWRGTRAAVIALVGFVSLLVTYYAVNLWIAGLHSYAR